MDTFDLKWPQTEATFFTDGWRCRIVWREKRGGLGGTIDNNEQCKKRVARSLLTAPYLLNALRARGHGPLAEEIESMADVDLVQVETQPSAAASVVENWLDALGGDAGWAQADQRRAKHWQPCAEVDGEALLLKAPAPKGRREWVLKRTFDDAKRKAEYVVAGDLRGVLAYLHDRGLFNSAADVDQWLAAVKDLDHSALAHAGGLWRKVSKPGMH